jgi:hypothetical protein
MLKKITNGDIRIKTIKIMKTNYNISEEAV